MGSTRVGVIAEGPIDHALLSPLLQRIAHDRAEYAWPVSGDDVGPMIRMRKRGAGGVLEAVRTLVKALRGLQQFSSQAFFVIVLDRRTHAEQRQIGKLVRGDHRFVMGVAIEEIEAWWLGDRSATLGWLRLAEGDVHALSYGKERYKAERDRDPKGTLDELTRASGAVESVYGRNGNLSLAREFAETWSDAADLDAIEQQCPRGFRPFATKTSAAFRRARSSQGT